MDPESQRQDPPEGEPRTGLERHLAVFLEESTLWPVLLVLVASFVTFGTALLFVAVVDRNLFALAAIAVLFWMSVDFGVRRRRAGGLGLAGGLVVLLWVLSALAAFAVSRIGGS